MRNSSPFIRFFQSRPAKVALFLLLAALSPLHAEDVLFFGNSFTSVNDVPALVEAIAVSKGKTITVDKVTKGGQGWDYHLSKPATDEALAKKAWNWVVLQDYSLNATHAAKKVENFMKEGDIFYDRIAKESPKSNIVLYETWAYAPQHAEIAGAAGQPGKFANADAMYEEIHKNYAALQVALQAKDPKRQVLIAPVGTAFAKCAHDHPEINLYAPDFKHPNIEGSYLSALVIYATLFNDTPMGAADGKKTDAAINKVLREIAVAVTQKK